MLKRLFWIGFFLFLTCSIGAGIFVTWGYYRVTRDLPKLTRIQDYRPAAISTVYANDGSRIAEFYDSDHRRYPMKLADVPQMVIHAFLAAEDSNFYQHQGIDFASILRALYKNIEAGSARQGGSTITQQVVKNLLLTPEKNIERKIKEAILSYRLEKSFSKDEILEIYLNQIYFGNNAYGLKAAARLYFKKEVAELNLAEAAMLAGLPQAPSRYSPIRNLQRAKNRQRYVLGQMLRARFITKDEMESANKQEISAHAAYQSNIFHAPYFTTEVRRILLSDPRWKHLNIDLDGLEIHTTLDLKADEIAAKALQRGLREIDKRRGWRGPLKHIASVDKKEFLNSFPVDEAEAEEGKLYPALVTEIIRDKGVARIDLGKTSSAIDYRNIEWARKKLNENDNAMWITAEQMLKPGDVIEVSLIEGLANAEKKDFILPGIEKRFKLDQTPLVDGAVVLLDPLSGRVLTVQGGYDYERSRFNRATQGLRQPGSTFKPIIYLAAVDAFKYTPASIVYDEPRTFRIGNQFWTPGNYDRKFLGAITLRNALEKSRNLISAEVLAGIGVDPIINYARKLGITSPLGRNLSLSLGSSEVTLLELTRAFGVFAAKGVLFDSVFIEKILDRDGNELYNYNNERLSKAEQVINENSAFIMANMMKGVVESGTGTRVKALKRPSAGKTGTSNDQMDAWYVGFTPQYSCGVWIGFDEKKKIGERETGGVAAAPIWLYLMQDFLDYKDSLNKVKLEDEAKAEAERLGIQYMPPQALEPLDFSVPPGVEPYWIDKASGVASTANTPGAIYEYFLKGTEPNKHIIHTQDGATTYLESDEL